MNYRHAYHAGNFADVFKHIVLMLCLEHLKLKNAAFRVIDTHAGAGRYRLDQGEAERTGEWREGIGRLIGPQAAPLAADFATSIAPYLAALRAENPASGTEDDLQYYPGSPVLVQSALRTGDALIANELHPDDADLLRAVLGKDKLCKVTSLDGYAALKALLPPKERRGLVLIDPPYEQPGELVRMTNALAEALKRFANGLYLLWYPIKDEKTVARFHRGALDVTAAAGVPPPLRAEVLLRPARNPSLLNGAGLLIVNAPHTLEDSLAVILPILADRFGDPGKGSFKLGKLTSPTATAGRGIRPTLGKTDSGH